MYIAPAIVGLFGFGAGGRKKIHFKIFDQVKSDLVKLDHYFIEQDQGFDIVTLYQIPRKTYYFGISLCFQIQMCFIHFQNSV